MHSTISMGQVGLAFSRRQQCLFKMSFRLPCICIASVVLLKLHGCVVSHMQVLATTLLSMHNIKYLFCWSLTAELI